MSSKPLDALIPRSPILVFTIYDGDQDIRRAFLLGAKGYVLKTTSSQEIITAVRTVDAGQMYLPASIIEKREQAINSPRISKREAEVLKLVAEGLSNKEIANRLGIALATIKVHLKSILSKLEVKNRTQAVSVAEKRGLFRRA